jgi:VCBS repeat-containing protein
MAWDDIIKGGNASDNINGGSGDDFIQGRAGGDFLDGGDGNDEIQGNEGDDYIRGGRGNDFIHGGTGTDTAVYSGSVKDYSYSRNGEEFFLSHTGGSHIDGNDRLISIERLVFADATIDLTQNNAPIAFDDAASTNEDVGTYSGSSVLSNDFDWEHQSLTATAGTFNGVYGTLVLNANGTYTYTPYASTQSLALGQTVQDSFTYTVSDGSLSDTGTLIINIAGRNDAPVANPDTAAAGENQTITVNVRANDTDVDNGAVLTVVAASAPAGKGTASIVGNQVQWNPGTAFDHLALGATETVVVSYTISDEHGATSTSSLTITVTGTNDGPVANADTAAGTENQILGIDALANDTDVDDGAVKTLVSVSAPAGKGSASIVGNQVRFDPGTAFDHLAVGATETVVLSYTMKDEHGATASSTITVTVTGTNDGPVANPDAASTGENSPVTVNVLANDTDVDDGAVLTVTAASTPAGQGSASVVANQVAFDPGSDFDYLDTGETANVVVSYTITDEHGATSSSTVTVTVNGANDAPVANDDTASTDENSPVSGNVLANDTDPDDPLTVTNPGTYIGFYGTLVLAADGSYTYTPGGAAALLNNGDVVNDVFNYTASDGTVTDTATLTITVSGLSGVPDANDDLASTTENSSVSGNVLANDTDPEGDPLTVSDPGSYVGTYGTLTLGANGSYTYTPNAAANSLAVGESVEDVFTYTAFDGGASDTATLTVTVNGTNDAPTITGGDFSGSVEELPDGDPGENSAVHSDSGSVSFADVDASDTHSASFAPQGAFYLGTFSLGPVDQSGDSVGWNFSVSDAALEGLSEGEVRIQTYTIQVSDGHGGTDSQNVTVTITGAGVGVGPQSVWYIDNSAVGSSTNVGTAANPFTSIAAFNAAQGTLGGPQPGNTIHLLAGTGTYAEADGINLLDGQILVGDASGPLRPTIVATAGDGIDVAENNTITGVDIGSTGGAGIDDDGGTVGTLTVTDVGIGGVRTGQIVDIDHGGTLNVTLNEAASTASSGGAIDLNAVGGSFTVTGATTISGATGGGVDITSGINLAVDFQGGLSASTGAGTAVNFQGNMGSSSLTIDGLNLVTTTGTGLSVTSGGTVEVTGAGNSIATTGGTAVNIAFATIGAGGVTLDSVSSLGGSAAGIILNTAGSGGFNVGGGTIANKVGAAGISINATSNIALDDMSITGNSNGGIVGTNVADFSLTDSTLTNNGSSATQGAVYFTGLTGTVDLLGNVIGGSSGDNVHIVQTGGSLDLEIADNGGTQAIMGSVNNATGNDSVFISTSGSASLLLTVDGVDFQGAIGDLLQVLAEGQSTQDLTISNNQFANTQSSVAGGGGVSLGGGGGGSNINVDFSIVGNSFTGADGNALSANYNQQSGQVRGNIEGNTIGVDDGVATAEGSSGGSGISVGLGKFAGAGTASLTVSITDNDIHDIAFGAGIALNSDGGGSANPAVVEATITGNTVDELGQFALAALYASVGGTAGSGDFAQLGLALDGNTLDASTADFSAAVLLTQLSSDSHYYVPGYTGSAFGEFASPTSGTASADLEAFWSANNLLTGGAFAFPGAVDASGVGGTTGIIGDPFIYPVWP